ncbi:HEAT repeat domain-containing protein [Micromonospora sp. NPDC049523]|uniref:HEAT repeat domain-containing protein n=1 Tax=Micromonospora sp. NPDC049523 TaxID=3155921 RepID=UPI003436D9A4
MTKVYVSATFRDLQECRAAVQLALRRLRVEDMAMESYVAEDRRPLERCLADVRECDVYVGIFAWRYGFVPPGYGRSITELEYREALNNGKPCLIFLLDEEAPWPRRFVDRGPEAEQIEALRAELADRHMCSIFTEPGDLAARVTAAVAVRLAETGWSGHGLNALGQDTVQRYFSRLRQHYGVLDLDALTPTESEDYLQIGLASVFVEQSVRSDPPPAEMPREWRQRVPTNGHLSSEDVPAEVNPTDLAHLQESYRAKPLQRLFDVLGSPEQRAVVLLGDPGSGKSTAARYLVLALAGGHPDDRLAALTDHLPLLVELRSYVTLAAENRCQSFVDYLDHRAHTDGLGIDRTALLRHLTLGRTVAVFDGLDEVFDRRRREEVASQIANFAADFPQVRVIVTSRVVAYSRRILTDVGFTHFTLQDLDADQTAEFLGHWYRLAIHDRPQDALVRRARLLDAMRHSHAIRELAGNPLLLTILAIIGKHQALPRERWKLYDHAATVLVEHWDVNRHLRDQHQDPDFIGTEDKKELLRRLAYRMQSADRGLAANYIAAEELSQVFEDYLVERYHRDPGAARAIALSMINQFRERNFILSRYGPHLYGFVHRTFLEFFCADAVLTRFQHDRVLTIGEVKDLFRRHWVSPSWREVLRLLAGALPEERTAEVVDLLTNEVNRSWPPTAFPTPPWNLALAVQCLAEVRTISPAVAKPAAALLRKTILLLEHGVAINDRETAKLIEEEILPAAQAIGTAWPGREAYLSWYRRRGVRVVWSPVSAYAARLAAMLSTPAERIDDLFDEVLGGLDDSSAAYAWVAGLAEVAQLATATEDSPPHRAAAERVRNRLVRRARDDGYSGARLTAVQALGECFGTDQRARELLAERARMDGYAGVRLASVQALGERFRGETPVRNLLLAQAGLDSNPGVRRAALQILGERCGGEDELRSLLLDRLGTDADADVIRMAAQVLIERFNAPGEVRDLLIERAGADGDPVLRRAVVRALGERLGIDPVVQTVLVERIRVDTDAGVLRAAAQSLVERFGPDEELRKLLVTRALEDTDEVVRRAALRLLIECFAREVPLCELLITVARADRDTDVRLVAVRALADQVGTAPEAVDALTELARTDGAPRIRLLAVAALVDRVGMDPDVRDVLAGLARSDTGAAVRLASVRALAEWVTEPALRELIIERAREDSGAEVRLAAVRALAREAGTDAEVHAVLVDRARHDSDGGVFAHAAAVIAALAEQDEPAWELLAGRVGVDKSARLRLAAMRMLVDRFGDRPELAEILLDRVRLDPDAELLRVAATALVGQFRPGQAQCKALLGRADSDDVPVRCVAVRILGEAFGADQGVREVLIDKARDDDDVQVRREVLRVLGERLADHPEVRALFVERLHDPDWSVRVTAVRLLGTRFGADPQTRTLLTQLAREDGDHGFRRFAGQALTWLPGADPDQLPDVPR